MNLNLLYNNIKTFFNDIFYLLCVRAGCFAFAKRLEAAASVAAVVYILTLVARDLTTVRSTQSATLAATPTCNMGKNI